jgi:hypothetical protein
MSTQTVYQSHQKKKRVVLLSYDEAKNDPGALKAMKKPIYGIVSAPKSWFDRLIEVCRASELTTATTDEGLLIMTSGEQVVGVLALHVDDAIGGGIEEFHGVMAKIGKTLAMGSHEISNFRYKGLRVSTVFKDEQPVFEINVDGDDYLASCRTMDVPLGEDTDLLPPQSMTDYRSVVGPLAMRRPSSTRTWCETHRLCLPSL